MASPCIGADSGARINPQHVTTLTSGPATEGPHRGLGSSASSWSSASLVSAPSPRASGSSEYS